MTALPNRNRRAELREATRREILDFAWDIARTEGLASLTLREVAQRMGMRPPSLYTHFESKNAIYDAMFGESWQQLLDAFAQLVTPGNDRKALLHEAELFFEFATSDLARYQLMNQRTIPGFTPTPQAYAPSVEAYDRLRESMRIKGVRSESDLDLWTGLLAGCVDQQLANDPGGRRWRRQLVRIVDMFCDEVGVAGPRLRRTR
jgi:AcrR family transcriptional regulator